MVSGTRSRCCNAWPTNHPAPTMGDPLCSSLCLRDSVVVRTVQNDHTLWSKTSEIDACNPNLPRLWRSRSSSHASQPTGPPTLSSRPSEQRERVEGSIRLGLRPRSGQAYGLGVGLLNFPQIPRLASLPRDDIGGLTGEKPPALIIEWQTDSGSCGESRGAATDI